MIAPIGKNGADCFLGIGQSFMLGVAFRDDLRQSWDKHGKAALFLRLQYHREALVRGHLLLHA